MKKNFLEEMKERWPKLDFSNSVYVNYYTKFDFACPIHGTQTKLPKYVKKYGCGICSRHGIFEQRPDNHLAGTNCPFCAKRKIHFDDFDKRANKIHNNKYQYKQETFQSIWKHTIIVCPTHGNFSQLPGNHLAGHGCKKCANQNPYDTESFRKVSSEKHPSSDFSKTEYNGMRTECEFVCPKHGTIKNKPFNILYNNPCPKCSRAISKPHRKLLEAFPDIEWSINDRKVLK